MIPVLPFKGINDRKDLRVSFQKQNYAVAILCSGKYTLLDYASVYSFSLHFIADVSQMFSIVHSLQKHGSKPE